MVYFRRLRALTFYQKLPGNWGVVARKSPRSEWVKLSESYVLFFLALEVITVAAVNCKTSFMRESSITCNAVWEQFKMVDDRKMVTFL